MFSILQEALATGASGAGGPSAPGLMSRTRVPRPSRLRVEPEAGELLTCLPGGGRLLWTGKSRFDGGKYRLETRLSGRGDLNDPLLAGGDAQLGRV